MRRRQPPPEPEVLRATLPRPLAPREAAVCAIELAKTLLFLRAQLPTLFAELRAGAVEPDAAPGAEDDGGELPPARPLRRKRVPAADRRARKTLAAVDALEALLTPAVFADAALEARCAPSRCPA